MTPPHILVVAADDHRMRSLDATLRLGGFTSLPRRSVAEARRLRAGTARPDAVLVDLEGEPETGPDLLRELVDEVGVPVVAVLAAGSALDPSGFLVPGVRLLVEPYEPTTLYAALKEEAA